MIRVREIIAIEEIKKGDEDFRKYKSFDSFKGLLRWEG
jgi:hypothetical protein